jgi:adenosylhomocysteinase
VIVLAEGRLVGQSCAEAHPAEVMDLTFATQALATERLAAGDPLPPGVHPVPAGVDERVARLKLAALGVRCDDLTAAAQEGYLRGWRLGT